MEVEDLKKVLNAGAAESILLPPRSGGNRSVQERTVVKKANDAFFAELLG